MFATAFRGPRLLLASALLAVAAGTAGCDQFNDLLGIGRKSPDRLQLQSLSLWSDHPEDLAEPTGNAVATTSGVVQFLVTGTFLNLDQLGVTVERDVTGAVLWTTTDPTLIPGGDGRLAVTGSSGGSTVLTATSPAVGDLPAMASNPITLTIH